MQVPDTSKGFYMRPPIVKLTLCTVDVKAPNINLTNLICGLGTYPQSVPKESENRSLVVEVT